MKHIKKIILLVPAFLVACASGSLTSSSSKDGFKMRSYQEETLPNGLRLLYVQDHTLPKVRITALVRMGGWHDPEGIEGVSALTSHLLEDGTATRTGPQVAEELAFLGADFSSSTDQEKTSLSVSSLVSNKEKTLSLFAEMMMGPSFADREVRRRKAEVIAGLQKLTENPNGYADLLLDETIFGVHPYGRLVAGSLKSVPKIERSDVMRQYFKYFRPSNVWVAIAGDFDDNFKAKVKATFGSWSNSPASGDPQLSIKSSPLNALRLVSKSGLQQSQIRIGGLGIKRQDPDFLKLRLAALILGGAFESRLNLKIRDELGLTYSISSKFDALKDGGSFEISTFSRNDKAAEVVKQTRLVLADFVKNGVTSRELDAAKTLLISQFPATIETPGETSSSLLRLRYYQIPDTYLQNYIQNVSAISLSEVNEAIRKHLQMENLKTVVFADQAQVLEALKTLGPVATETVDK